jgi:O-methyltransferase involved in polyketide biosynthesis
MNRILSLTAGMALAFLASSAHAATTTGVVVSTDTPTNVVTIQTADGQKFSFEKNDATRQNVVDALRAPGWMPASNPRQQNGRRLYWQGRSFFSFAPGLLDALNRGCYLRSLC